LTFERKGGEVSVPTGASWPVAVLTSARRQWMDFRTILYEKLGAVLRVTTNRPHVLNAQSRVMLLELDEAFRRAADDGDVRVVIVAGAGEHFSAGHDIGSAEELEDQKAHPTGPGMPENLKRLSELYLETTLRSRDLPKPTIAQVQGYCIMGGLMLASCCDLIVAAEDAVFADRAVRWGGSHIQYFSMPWDLGPRKTKEYLFTGDYVDAREALRLGLVNRVVPRAGLAAETLALAQRIALQDPFALKLAKASVNETLDIQGQRRAIEAAFKNYMLTIPHRQTLGTYGAEARAKSVKDRIETRDRKFGDAAGG
jgi:enoyl-CoA hydratase